MSEDKIGFRRNLLSSVKLIMRVSPHNQLHYKRDEKYLKVEVMDPDIW